MRPPPATVLAALLVSTSLAATACGSPLSCDEEGCTSGPTIQFTDSTFASTHLTPDGSALDTIYPQAGPDSPAARPSPLTIRVSHDDTRQTEQTFEPNYETVRPNGKGCPPVAQQAEVELNSGE